MKLWMRAAIFGSIFMVLFFLYRINKENSVVYIAKPQYTEAIVLPQPLIRKEIKREDLLIGLPEEEEPFRPLFFESMILKGIMKDNFGRWLAIFTDGKLENNSRFLKFAAGDTHDGITLLKVDNRGCVIRYGNIERRFEVKD